MTTERKLIGTYAECASWNKCICVAMIEQGDCSHPVAMGQVPRHTLETFGCIYFSEKEPKQPSDYGHVQFHCDHEKHYETVNFVCGLAVTYRCTKCGAYGVPEVARIRWLTKGPQP